MPCYSGDSLVQLIYFYMLFKNRFVDNYVDKIVGDFSSKHKTKV